MVNNLPTFVDSVCDDVENLNLLWMEMFISCSQLIMCLNRGVLSALIIFVE